MGVSIKRQAMNAEEDKREVEEEGDRQREACTGTFSGDVPGFTCDHAGEFDDEAGTWDLVFDAGDPALQIDPLTCFGFWGGDDCDGANPVEVTAGSAGEGDDPTILALFPNDAPRRSPVLVETTT